MFVRLTALTLAASLAAVGVAQAQTKTSGPYVRGNIGYFIPGDGEAEATSLLNQSTVEFKGGLAVAGAGGYRINPILRVEGEVGYRTAEVDSITSPGAGAITVSGDLDSWTFMANGYADFGRGKFRPYIGAGLGMASVVDDGMTAATVNIDIDQTAFAYQLMGGVGYAFSPRLTLDLEYRYLEIGDVDLSASMGGVSAGQVLGLEGNHNLMVGLRYNF